MAEWFYSRMQDEETVASESPETTAPGRGPAQLAVLCLIGVISMLFAGFASAYLVRRVGTDWQPVLLPQLLWFNTAVLLVSSLTLGHAQRAQRKFASAAATPWLAITALLGLVFLGGQIVAWRQLAAEGFYLPGNPYNSFFYVLTAAHGLHVLGGVAALLYVLVRAFRVNLNFDLLHGCATYWHFLGGLWVALFALLLFF